jgi:nucleoside transporter
MDKRRISALLSVMMFLEFFIWGAWFVTIGNYMTAHGMAGDVPWAYSFPPIAAIISPFFLGMIADRFFATERVLGVMHLLGAVTLLALPSLETQPALFKGMLLLHSLCFMPTLGLTNTLAFHNMTDQEKQFPLIRVFGTLGWIVAGILVSAGLQADTAALQFYVAGIAAAVLGVFSFMLPHTPPPAAGTAPTARDILGLDSLALMKERSFAVFILCSFLTCIPLAAYYQQAAIFVKAMNIANPGFKMTFGQMSEVFFMLVMPLFFARLGVKWMLLIGMLAWVLRYGLFAAAASNGALAPIVMGIMLHGICYDFFFVTGQIYVDKKAPNAIRGQAQGFLVLVTQGVGSLIGAQAIGAIVKANTSADKVVNWQSIWIVPCVMAAVIAVIFFALFHEKMSAANDGAHGPLENAPVEPAPG